jgi:hypothetical protein
MLSQTADDCTRFKRSTTRDEADLKLQPTMRTAGFPKNFAGWLYLARLLKRVRYIETIVPLRRR